MTENLLETAPETGAGSGPAATETSSADMPSGAPPESGAASSSPSGLPEKFWDQERSEVRIDSLVKSYLALEQKLGASAGVGVPDSPDGYDIKMKNELFASEPDVNAKLHAAGLSQDQAQSVYDLASEYMLPMVSEVAAEFHTQSQVERLVQRFGGEDKWGEMASQIKHWGRAKFPDEVFHALSSTYEGVLTMHKMMGNGEPGLIEGAGAGEESLSEEGLKQMMHDPRYWRDHDPAFVERVRAGFKRLYPD